MKLVMDTFEAVGIDMRVDLGGADIGVAEKFLHHAQIRATGKQVRGERVAQFVRVYMPQPGGATDTIEPLP